MGTLWEILLQTSYQPRVKLTSRIKHLPLSNYRYLEHKRPQTYAAQGIAYSSRQEDLYIHWINSWGFWQYYRGIYRTSTSSQEAMSGPLPDKMNLTFNYCHYSTCSFQFLIFFSDEKYLSPPLPFAKCLLLSPNNRQQMACCAHWWWFSKCLAFWPWITVLILSTFPCGSGQNCIQQKS